MLFGIIAHFVATVGGNSIFPLTCPQLFSDRHGWVLKIYQSSCSVQLSSNPMWKMPFLSFLLSLLHFRKPKTTVCAILFLAGSNRAFEFRNPLPTQYRKRTKWWIGYRHCRYRAYRCRIHCRYRRRRISRINHHTPRSTRLICTPRICIRRHLSMRCTVPRADRRRPRRRWPPLPTCIRMSVGCSMGPRTGMGELNSSISVLGLGGN